jgi:hypothetical protein
MKVLATCAALIATTSILHAQDGDGMGRGVGYSSCALYAKRYAEDPKMADFLFFTWAQGYMTAANVALAAAGNRYHDLGGSIDDQEAHLRRYCSSHPTASYNDAVLDLYASLPLKHKAPFQ